MERNLRPYHDPRWKQARLATLARDSYLCQIQLPGCKTRANEADHIVDWEDGGHPFDLANLRAACKSCNIALRNQRVAARARAQRTALQRPTSRTW